MEASQATKLGGRTPTLTLQPAALVRAGQRLASSPWGVLLLASVLALATAHSWAPRHVAVLADGQQTEFHTTERSVRGILGQAGVKLAQGDSVWQQQLDGTTSLLVRRGTPVRVWADGAVLSYSARSETVGEALAEGGIFVGPGDRLQRNTSLVRYDAPLVVEASAPPPRLVFELDLTNPNSLFALPLLREAAAGLGGAPPAGPTDLVVERAVPIRIHDDGLTVTIWTTEDLVGEALGVGGVELREGDAVLPSPDTPVRPGLHVYIRRAKSASILVDGSVIRRRTLARTVGSFLEQEGVVLAPLDIVEPSLEQPITRDLTVTVTRVVEQEVTLSEVVPHRTRWLPDPTLELDQQRVESYGSDGVYYVKVRIHYENGVETWRTRLEEWMDPAPEDAVYYYGTKIVVRQVETEQGPREYWRKFRVLATWYDADHAGKSRDHPAWGITRSGLPAGYGIIAVDPTVIPMMSELYVPGYGVGLAGDTGGMIKGRHIDLAFDVGADHSWGRQWVDVYLLTPVPPEGDFPWRLPDYPKW